MVLARMALTNYRGFASRQSIELRPITVILGRNNAGKSALVRAPIILAGGIDTDSQEPVDIDKISEELLGAAPDDRGRHRERVLVGRRVSIKSGIPRSCPSESRNWIAVVSRTGGTRGTWSTATGCRSGWRWSGTG
jgi:hypothetical protein